MPTTAQRSWLTELGLDLAWLDARQAPPPPNNAVAPGADSAAGKASAIAAAEAAADKASAMAAAEAAITKASAAPRAPQSASEASCSAPRECACTRLAPGAQPLAGVGSAEQPRYLIITEQPGLEDDSSGMVFQGKAGRLLQTMLRRSRLPEPDSVYCTYAVKCRRPGGQAPQPKDLAACRPWLQKQIAALQPQYIIAMGQAATSAVLGELAPGAGQHGGPYKYPLPDGGHIPVWLTHSPAMLLVHGELKAEAWQDLAALAAHINSRHP